MYRAAINRPIRCLQHMLREPISHASNTCAPMCVLSGRSSKHSKSFIAASSSFMICTEQTPFSAAGSQGRAEAVQALGHFEAPGRGNMAHQHGQRASGAPRLPCGGAAGGAGVHAGGACAVTWLKGWLNTKMSSLPVRTLSEPHILLQLWLQGLIAGLLRVLASQGVNGPAEHMDLLE